jgi:hypothetical protein
MHHIYITHNSSILFNIQFGIYIMYKYLFYQIHLIVFGTHSLDWKEILQLPDRSR